MSSDVFKRISEFVNPYAGKLLEYPEEIYAFFDQEKDKADLIKKLNEEKRSIYLEFGSGSGGHILELAKLAPDSLCIGFEIRFKRAVRTLEKARKYGISNVIIARTMGELAPEFFKLKSIQGLFINFPDPWEKKRWLKHRILTANKILSFIPLIVPGGFISIKTDHLDYFKACVEDLNDNLLSEKNVKIEVLNYDLVRHEFGSLPCKYFSHIESEFEKLFRSQNGKINYLRLNIIN